MRKIKTSFIQALITGIFLCLPIPAAVMATNTSPDTGGTGPSSTTSQSAKKPSDCISGKVLKNGDCAPVLGNGCSDSTSADSCLAHNSIIKYLRIAINTLAAGVGVVVTAMIIYGGIQYMVAGDNSGQVTEAKKRITNALIALVLFMFIYALLQWLIPGGVF